jgi:hypothetical protein
MLSQIEAIYANGEDEIPPPVVKKPGVDRHTIVERRDFEKFKHEIFSELQRLEVDIENTEAKLSSALEPIAADITRVNRRLNSFEEAAAMLAVVIKLTKEEVDRIDGCPVPPKDSGGGSIDDLVIDANRQLAELKTRTEQELTEIEEEIDTFGRANVLTWKKIEREFARVSPEKVEGELPAGTRTVVGEDGQPVVGSDGEEVSGGEGDPPRKPFTVVSSGELTAPVVIIHFEPRQGDGGPHLHDSQISIVEPPGQM